MHGEIRPHDARLSKEAFEQEKKILQPNFKALLRSERDQVAAGGWEEVIERMVFELEETGGKMAPDNDQLPAAYTYFGQLVAHDITAHRFFGSVSPTLGLRTIYGMGPTTSPQFYQHEYDAKEEYNFRGVKMVLEPYELTGKGNPKEIVYDFFRITQKAGGQKGNIPLMADARNDQNFITSQLVIKLVQLHNKLAERYYSRNISQGYLFEKVSKKLAHKYQRVILTDYLPRILHSNVDLNKLVSGEGFLVYNIEEECRLSEVFARAAMRFGHTQVRQMYQVQVGRQQRYLFNSDNDLGGFKRDLSRKIDWICLLDEIDKKKAFQPAKGFDTNIVLPLANLPFLPQNRKSLIAMNIDNSYQNFILDTDCWKSLDKAGFKPALDIQHQDWTKNPPSGTIPLWVYFLLESGIQCNGKTLGPLCSQIVAEQIVWALLKDPNSILNQKDSEGSPILFDWEKYTLKELLKEAGEDFDGKTAQMPEYWRSLVLPPVHISDPRIVEEPTAATLLTGHHSIYSGDEPGLPYTLQANGQIEFGGHPKDIPEGEDGLEKRTEILNNGHYWYPSNMSEALIRAHIADGTLPLNSIKKREIRCYISRKMILNLCGANNQPSEKPGGNDKDIKGLFFIFGLDKVSPPLPAKVCLIARRTGINGTFPTSSTGNTISDTWLGSNEILVSRPTEPTTGKVFIDNFVVDQYATLKEDGLPTQHFLLDDLLDLLDYLPLGNDLVVNVRLVFATPSETAQGELFELPPDQISIKDTPFFALTLDTGGVIVGSGRPYPYYCYPSST